MKDDLLVWRLQLYHVITFIIRIEDGDNSYNGHYIPTWVLEGMNIQAIEESDPESTQLRNGVSYSLQHRGNVWRF